MEFSELHVCGNCAAFGAQIDEVESTDDGACRLKPPQIIAIDDKGGFANFFPSVNREDWCLQWRETR